jgi:Lipocalin-like domain
LFFASQSATEADESIVGTYRLISSQRLIVETGETEESYGKDPTGFITYGSDGRMMVIITFSNRSKPESLDKLTVRYTRSAASNITRFVR